MPTQYPGYVGYKIIANEALQTGVHCGDIAIHIESLRANQEVQRAIAFLKSPQNAESYAGIMHAQQVLVSAVKQKRQEICEFAIEQIIGTANDEQSQRSMQCCELLAPEIQAAIWTTEVEIAPIVLQWQASEAAGTTIEEFCRDPKICAKYINEYYLQGDNMFKVPPPNVTGMMDLVAMQLKRKIIVISARNGAPYESTPLNVITNDKEPICVGYDGHLHFVELVPLTLEELSENYDKLDVDDSEMAVIECLLAIRLAEVTNQATQQQLTEANNLLIEAKVLYANTISMQESFYKVFLDFIRLMVTAPNIDLLVDALAPERYNEASLQNLLAQEPLLAEQYRTAAELHLLLLEKQIAWLEPRQDLRQIPAMDKHLQNKLLAIEIHNKLNKAEPFDVEYLKHENNILNIIKMQASRVLTIEKNHDTNSAKLEAIRAIFINIQPELAVDAPVEPAPAVAPEPLVAPRTFPTTKPSFFDKLKDLLDRIFSAILFPFNWLLSVLTDSTTPIHATHRRSAIDYKVYLNPSNEDPAALAVLPLASNLQDHFERKLRSTNDRTTVIAEWHAIMQPLTHNEYIQFCIEVEKYMQQNTKENQTQPYLQDTPSPTILPLHNRRRSREDEIMEVKQRVKAISFKYNF